VKVAEGASSKKAARGVWLRTERRRGNPPLPDDVSNDWRMVGDCRRLSAYDRENEQRQRCGL
ncbi:MAG: hypothetical protein ACRDPA_17185, partial [Solirubrobacteraceae bacterium]